LTEQYFELAEGYYSNKKYNEAIFYLKKLLVLDVPDPKIKDKSKEMMEICARIVKYKKDHKEKPF
jgi:hypothetical protein